MKRWWCAVLVGLGGCTFPDVQVDPADTRPPPVDTSVDMGGEVDSDKLDTADVADTGDDVGDSDTSSDTAADSKSETGDTAWDGNPCDKDGDGWTAIGGTCGGKDCDDNDKNANPDVKTFLTLDATKSGNPLKGDWNCDLKVEKQYPVNVTCSSLLVTACAGAAGFKGDPVCGTSGTYVSCKVSGTFCVDGTTSTQVQGCK